MESTSGQAVPNVAGSGTHLLRTGAPMQIVSARAGHANPSIAFNIYSHLLKGDQDHAASVVDEALRVALEE